MEPDILDLMMYAGGTVFATVGIAVGTVVGIINWVDYHSTKEHLINLAIRGEERPEWYTGRNKLDPYIPMFDKIFGGVGERLAERRFKAGKFEKLIKRYSKDC